LIRSDAARLIYSCEHDGIAKNNSEHVELPDSMKPDIEHI